MSWYLSGPFWYLLILFLSKFADEYKYNIKSYLVEIHKNSIKCLCSGRGRVQTSKTHAKEKLFPNSILSTKIGSKSCSSDSKKVSGDFR